MDNTNFEHSILAQYQQELAHLQLSPGQIKDLRQSVVIIAQPIIDRYFDQFDGS
jgi:hypothetical protein